MTAVIGVVAVTAGASPIDESDQDPVSVQAVEAPTTAAASEVPGEAEADGLLFMLEEEKLARDVYRTLGEIWDTPVFSNIAASEQRHMDAILGLITTYGLDDSMYDETVGRFENRELQTMYDDLVDMGSQSVEAALEVGAIIEEVDIADLEEYLGQTTAEDTTRVYENLLRGSRNHLRAFVSQLEAAGVDRAPYLLETGDYESILALGTERGAGSRRAGGAASDVQRGSGRQGRDPQGGGRGLGGTGWGGGGFGSRG
jgi:hypothetical protein